MLTLSNVMQTTDNYFIDHMEDRKQQMLTQRYDAIESSIIWLRKELELKGCEITVTVKSNSLTVIHTLYGYEKIEQFLKGHEGDLNEMEALRNFMGDELDENEVEA